MFAALLFAVVPPILFLVGGLLVWDVFFQRIGATLLAILIVTGALGWAAILAVVYERALSEDIRALVSLARRGRSMDETASGPAYDLLASTLDQRNRQVGTLASEASRALSNPDRPVDVAAGVLNMVQRVMADPTWTLSVVRSADGNLLPTGVYEATADGSPVRNDTSDLEQWMATAVSDDALTVANGPWGAFAIVSVANSDLLGAQLTAPWQGRAALSSAEVDLLKLVGQHTGTALEHSLLFARVLAQADELNRLAAVQTDFLRGVTHDLQTPLTSIGALAAELRSGSVDPSAARDLDTIAHQADRLRRMVGQLLAASRLEAGAMSTTTEVFAVRPVIERIWDALRATRPFEIRTSGAPHLAVGDAYRFEQVMWAVLDNAVKYSPPGSTVAVEIIAEDEGLAVRVADNGTGMDEGSRSRAFEQFYRSEQARRLVPDGSGVGLYAADGLMRAMGGSIAIESSLGAGTTVILKMPAERADSDE